MIYRLILPQHQIGMFNIPFFISSLAPSINQAGKKKKPDWGFKDSIPVELQLQRLLIR